ncbi:hypothetical protein AAY473_004832 [Plecturocebus cupreus]
MESHCVTPAAVQWHKLGSLQPLTPWFKRVSCLNPLSSWGYRHGPSCLANQKSHAPEMDVDPRCLTLSPRLELNGNDHTHCSLQFLGSSYLPAATSQSWGSCHVTQAGLQLLVSMKTGIPHAGQDGLKLLTSGDPPTSEPQSAEIIGMRHCGWPIMFIFVPNFATKFL